MELSRRWIWDPEPEAEPGLEPEPEPEPELEPGRSTAQPPCVLPSAVTSCRLIIFNH